MYGLRRIQYPVESGNISLIAGNATLPAFWAHPAASRAQPGIVLLHYRWGLNTQTRAWTRRLAEAGYYVMTPDLYNGSPPATPEAYAVVGAPALEAGVIHAQAALDALRTHHHCTGQIGLIGWDMGGELAYRIIGDNPQLRACVVLGAPFDAYLTHIGEQGVPMLAIYGDSDPEIPALALNRLSSAFELSPARERLIIQAGVANDYLDERSPAYREPVAAKTWEYMTDFLYEHMEPKAPSDDSRASTRGRQL